MTEAQIVREALRWPPDTHHIGCESRRVVGSTCDCYAFLTNRAHEALDRLEANRDQWHGAANEESERAENSEAEVLRLTGELRNAIHGRNLARLDTERERQATKVERDELNRLSVEVQELIATWDESAEDLGPEWNALAERIEALR